MAAIEVDDVSKAYGGKKLFLEVRTTFSPGRRYGLTGPNGAGKSTFLKILSGEIEADTGAVRRPERTSVLKQDQFAFESWRAIDVVMMGNAKLWAAMSEKHELLGKAKLPHCVPGVHPPTPVDVQRQIGIERIAYHRLASNHPGAWRRLVATKPIGERLSFLGRHDVVGANKVPATMAQ